MRRYDQVFAARDVAGKTFLDALSDGGFQAGAYTRPLLQLKLSCFDSATS